LELTGSRVADVTCARTARRDDSPDTRDGTEPDALEAQRAPLWAHAGEARWPAAMLALVEARTGVGLDASWVERSHPSVLAAARPDDALPWSLDGELYGRCGPVATSTTPRAAGSSRYATGWPTPDRSTTGWPPIRPGGRPRLAGRCQRRSARRRGTSRRRSRPSPTPQAVAVVGLLFEEIPPEWDGRLRVPRIGALVWTDGSKFTVDVVR
jgi:hypothetical protein